MGRFSTKSQKSLWLTIVTIAILGTGAGLLWKSNNSNMRNRNLTAYTVTAETGKLSGLITASGELKAERTVNVSPDRQGLLKDLYVDEGDRVDKGQVLAVMDGGDYKFRLAELKADYQTKKLAYKRRRELLREGAISVEENDEYLNQYLTSKARLKQRQVEGNELFIRAPFNGLITARFAEPGAFVTPTTSVSAGAGSTSTSIVELSQGLEVAAKVAESEIGRIQTGQKANVRVEAFPNEKFQAEIKEISPRADRNNNVTSFIVTLIFPSRPANLSIGMTADVDFQTGETEERTLVPTVAIVTENGQPGLLIVGENKQPKFQKVELGNSSGSKTAILKGIKPGNLIFIDLPPWAKQKRSN